MSELLLIALWGNNALIGLMEYGAWAIDTEWSYPLNTLLLILLSIVTARLNGKVRGRRKDDE